jgi:hypothetical protein
MADKTDTNNGGVNRVQRPAIFLLACIFILGAWAKIERAHAQTTSPHTPPAAHTTGTAPPPVAPSSPPPPNVNPSSPNTVPQANETPVSPATPGTGPGSH